MSKYIKNSSNFNGLSILKEVGGSEKTIYARNFYHDRKIPDTEAIQKLRHFVDCIHNGILPDGRVLEDMANCIEKYLDGKRETLDSALNLEIKPRAGNAPAQLSNKSLDVEMFLSMMALQVEQGLNKNKAAEIILDDYHQNNEGEEINVESFLKQQRRIMPNYKQLKNNLKEHLKQKADK